MWQWPDVLEYHDRYLAVLLAKLSPNCRTDRPFFEGAPVHPSFVLHERLVILRERAFGLKHVEVQSLHDKDSKTGHRPLQSIDL